MDDAEARLPLAWSDANGIAADAVIAPPRTAFDDLHHDGDYSPWGGWRVQGWPVTTILRGTVVVEDGALNAEPGFGQFVPRKLDPDVLERPRF